MDTSVEAIKQMLLDTVAKPLMEPSGCHIDSTSSPIAAPPLPPSLTPSAAADGPESNPAPVDPDRLAKGSRLFGEWHFESEAGWAAMGYTLSTQLEADFETFRKHSIEHSIGCHRQCSFAVFKHECSGYTYEFNLYTMQQLNTHTNKVRRIMRKEMETSGAGKSLDFSDLLEEHKDTKLLQFWDRQLAPVRQRNFGYSAVSLDSDEGKGVATAVSSSLSGAAVPRILGVWRIQNKELMRDFLHFGAKLRRELTAEGKAGLLRCASLFHGTRNFGNVDTIAATGFDRNYSAAKDSTTAFGKGAYFAVSAAYSLRGYSCEHQALGGSLLFLANVWVAEHTRGDPSMLNPPFKRGSACLRYETTVDNVPAPSMHVVYRDGQSYPAYLIHFEGPGPAATGAKPQQITAQKTKPPKNPAVMVQLVPQHLVPQPPVPLQQQQPVTVTVTVQPVQPVLVPLTHTQAKLKWLLEQVHMQCGHNKEEKEKLLKMCTDYKARKVTLDQLHQFLQQQYNLNTQANPPPPPPPLLPPQPQQPPLSSLAPKTLPTVLQRPQPQPQAVVDCGRGSRQPRAKRGRDGAPVQGGPAQTGV